MVVDFCLFKVEVQYVNGKPTTGKDLIVTMSENVQFKNEQKVTTNDDGRATCIFQTSGNNKISFTVSFERVIKMHVLLIYSRCHG
jgi:hypothetical protein